MADIYIAYTSANREVARVIVRALSSYWSVWWDEELVGQYPREIEKEIQGAKCIVPLWSTAARESTGLHDELKLAQKYDLKIIPVRIEPCDPPFGFGTYSTVDLIGWDGDPHHPGLQQLQVKVSKVIPLQKRPGRPATVFRNRLQLPSIFASVSSHETQLTPEDAIAVLTTFGSKTVLLSAYDFHPDRCDEQRLQTANDLASSGSLILMDSGNYEAMRLNDQTWTPEQLRRAVEKVPHDLLCSFDILDIVEHPDQALKQLLGGIVRDKNYTNAPIVPIVHAPRLTEGGYYLDSLPTVLLELAKELRPPMLAIPERELGPGLIARAQSVKRVREALDNLTFYQPLHILGTGNPWSIVVLAAAGADSFDGLEWCRVVVDKEHNRLNHFQHFDFFLHQARLADSAVAAASVDDPNVHFAGKAAFHNLDYYTELERNLRKYALKRSLETQVVEVLGPANKKQLIEQIPGLFE